MLAQGPGFKVQSFKVSMTRCPRMCYRDVTTATKSIGWKAIAGAVERDAAPTLTRFKLDLNPE